MKALNRFLFVRNESTPPASRMCSFTLNLLPKLVRHDTMEGRDFIVVPMVMLTEGVHKGSEGPLYYPPDELAKTPVVWNHKPVVVYHPEINGQGVSACDPDILTNHKVGYVMNTQYEKKTGRLKAEAWIDPIRADEVDPRIMEAVNKNTVMELSTGVFVDSEASLGKWNKEEYVGIARNYRPDHLAILPDKIGACSIKDGAGFLRNQGDFSDAAQSVQQMNGPRVGGRITKLERQRRKTLKGLEGDPSTYEPGVGGESSVPSVNTDKVAKNVDSDTDSLLERIAKKMGILKNDEPPFDSIRSQLSDAIKEECGCSPSPSGYGSSPYGSSPYIVDVFSNFFVYEYNNRLWQCGYSTDDDKVVLDEEDPVEVERVPPQYRPVSANNQERGTTNNEMNKKKLIDGLIANSNGNLTEADRARLEAFTEQQLEKIVFGATPPAANAAAPVTNAGKAAADGNDSEDDNDEDDMPAKKKAKKAPAKNEDPQTVDEYINSAPGEIREVLTNGVQSYNEEKSKIIKGLAKNGAFTEAELSSKPLGELRKLARLAGVGKEHAPRILNFAGQSPVAMEENPAEQEVLTLPVMNFGKQTTEAAAAAK